MCEDSGKIEVFAKSAAKTNSKLAGHLTVGVKTEVMLAPGKFVHLAGARMINDYSKLNNNLELLLIKWSSLQLVNDLVYGNEVTSEIFNVVDNFLSELADNKLELLFKQILLDVLTMHLLTLIGIKPNLNNQAQARYFNYANASLDDKEAKDSFTIDLKLRKLLNLFFDEKISWPTKVQWIKKIKYDQDSFDKLHKLVKNYYHYQIGSEVNDYVI